MNIRTQVFLVLGVSKSGYAVAKHILFNGGKCYLFEELSNHKIDGAISELISLGAVNLQKDNLEEIVKKIDCLVISPGVPINHYVAVMAKNFNKRIIGELEYGVLQFVPPIIAVTGTNGKTTTANMIYTILTLSGKKCGLMGTVRSNICGKERESSLSTNIIRMTNP